ncbi:molybdenum cofactor biosynthesis protein MoaE [Sandarakinorhabdus cyanobacteriorum]|uniref:Molybdopterin synthase catalytic subunit n=1 Tax=Sandarakinorhabdus cyanobacteriorum TaxID=1981098 RepID=A0A255YXS3_9SPHN|nr:molybdenum cofactor biosynthesis protein MoaE [Sandarakinorhabdus cyanobacteriorum]OYQ34037.1 molybdenum cofactor biosynthesis protein MoaE [Sandarakinorhabdus cyanobacteriorum]
MIAARLQSGPFDPAAEQAALLAGRTDLGAAVQFTGLVRADDGLAALTLEHYPGMTLAQMQAIAAEAAKRWPGVLGSIIHRHGRLLPGEPIVLVTTASPHRGDAFAAAQFLMDWLKTKAPFWKKEEWANGTTRWVEAKASDDAAADRWA